MKKEKIPQHTQLPNDMLSKDNNLKPTDLLVYLYIKKYMNGDTKMAYPSLDTLSKDSGMNIKSLRSSIQRLVNADYIKIHKEGRKNVYEFLKWENFEPFSPEFLDNKEISFKDKAYLTAIQQFMFKSPETGDGIITFDNTELATKINLHPRTIKKYDKDLEEQGLLDLETLTQKHIDTELPIIQKNYHLNKFQQEIVFAIAALAKCTQERFEESDQRIASLEAKYDEITKLLRKIAK